MASSTTVRLALPWLSAHLSTARSQIRTDAYLIEPSTADDFSFLGNGDVQAFMDELPLTTVNKGSLSYWAVPVSLSSTRISRIRAAMKQAQKLPLSPPKRGGSFTSTPSPASSMPSAAATRVPPKRTSSSLSFASPLPTARTPSYAVSLPKVAAGATPSPSPSYSKSAIANSSKPVIRYDEAPASPRDEELTRAARKEAAALDDFQLEVEVAQDE